MKNVKGMIAAVMMMLIALSATAQVERPKLVVGLVVDQMRWDYLYVYNNMYGEGGLKRMLRDGFSCENTMINYVPTVTSIGHASIFTGTTPAMHGISGNSFYIGNEYVGCCKDTTVTTIGSKTDKGQSSPHRMLSTTIGDELKTATDFRAKVIGVALKDRAAILPAGHSADAAYWWDNKAKAFITSSYYMTELPTWVSKFNSAAKKRGIKDPMMEPAGVTLTMDMALAAIDNEQLGRHDDTDMLTVSISSTDAIGHTYGTRGEENRAVFKQLDVEVERLLNHLDATVGKGNYLIFLTADHGAAHNYNLMKKNGIPAGAWESWKRVGPLNEYLKTQYSGADNLVLGEDSYRFYLDHDAIAKAGLKLCEVKRKAIDWLQKEEGVWRVVDLDNVAGTTLPAILREQIMNGYNPERCGDIFVVTRPQVMITDNSSDFRGTTHGAWNPYDAHIPLVFMGWNISHGATNERCHIVDIAPTVCALLHIQMPNAAIGTAIVPVTK